MKWHNNYPNQPSLIYDIHLVNVDYSSLDNVIKTIGIIELTRFKRILIADAQEDGITLIDDNFRIEHTKEDLYDTFALIYSFNANNSIKFTFYVDKINIRRCNNESHYGLKVCLSDPLLIDKIRVSELSRVKWEETDNISIVEFPNLDIANALNIFLLVLTIHAELYKNAREE